MRTYELVFLVFLLPPIVWLLTGKSRFHLLARTSLLLAAVALAIHVVHEGVHWQLAPIYCAFVVVAALLFANPSRELTRKLLGGACLLLVLASAWLSYALPMFRLPQPTGTFAVGTTVLHLVDTNRVETHVMPPHGPRELMVQVWYPAAVAPRSRLAPYRRWAETTKLSSYMAVLKTHSYLDVPVAETATPFPVLLFNPAWKNPRTQNTYQMEDLASHGFVVAAIDHTYISEPVAFPDGRIIRSNNTEEIDDLTNYTLEQNRAFGNAEANYEAGDNSFVLDQLMQMDKDPDSRFFKRLDTNNVGVFGHSFGGGVAMQTALQDKRVRGAINLDGWIFGDVAERGLAKPLMLMYEPYYKPRDAELNSPDVGMRRTAELNLQDLTNAKATLAAHGGDVVQMDSAAHMNFTDRSLFSPIHHLAASGSISADRAHLIAETYTLAFFSKLLKGTQEPILLEMPSPFPEVKYQIWPEK
jgi:predicted dienelactone hydrolase